MSALVKISLINQHISRCINEKQSERFLTMLKLSGFFILHSDILPYNFTIKRNIDKIMT